MLYCCRGKGNPRIQEDVPHTPADGRHSMHSIPSPAQTLTLSNDARLFFLCEDDIAQHRPMTSLQFSSHAHQPQSQRSDSNQASWLAQSSCSHRQACPRRLQDVLETSPGGTDWVRHISSVQPCKRPSDSGSLYCSLSEVRQRSRPGLGQSRAERTRLTLTQLNNPRSHKLRRLAPRFTLLAAARPLDLCA